MALLPLVQLSAGLSDSERERYARHAALPGIGELGQRRLKAARVLVVGAGGLGSPVIMYLAAAGVGTIGIVDDDAVESSNLQRQVLHGQSALGRLKVAAAAARVADLNPHVTVVDHPVRLTADNATDIISGYDLVIDGADNFATRYLVNDTCVALGKPDVLGSVLRFEGQVSVFWAQAGPCYRCLFPLPPAEVQNCADAGVFGALCGVIGSMMATQALLLLTGAGDPLIARMQTINALASTTATMQVVPDPQCEVCATVPRTSLREHTTSSSRTVSALQLRDLLADRDAGRADFRLIDIREPHEVEICAIDSAELVPQAQFLEGIDQMHRQPRIILFCRSGVRSANALAALHAAGFSDASHLEGGILAWIDEVEPHLQPY